MTNASVFSFLFIYLGLLVRDLDDPFGYPPGFLERCLDEVRGLPLSVTSTMTDASSIDFSSMYPRPNPAHRPNHPPTHPSS